MQVNGRLWLLYLIKDFQVIAKNNINEKNKVNKFFDKLMREIKETKQKFVNTATTAQSTIYLLHAF